MIHLLSKISYKERIEEVPERVINPKYILNEKNRKEYIEKGYTILKGIVADQHIEDVLSTFEKIKQLPGYFESDKFQSTLAFGPEAHKLSYEVVNRVAAEILENQLDKSICRYDVGGNIIVKNKGCWLEPHHDSSIIDEYLGTTSYVWIPTVDMTSENGTFFALPYSHKWSAWQRSSQHPAWPLKPFEHFLWDLMSPILVNKGDVLLFDSGLIHASGSNNTDEVRIAFNLCVVEKNQAQVQYVKDSWTPAGKINKYLVDDTYWQKGNLWGRPKGYKHSVESLRYPEVITQEFILKHIEKYGK